MIALATPFGNYVKMGVESTTEGLFDVNQGALDVIGIVIDDNGFTDTNEATNKAVKLVLKANGDADIYSEKDTIIETITAFSSVPDSTSETISTIIIENGVTTIAPFAFRGTSITSITIPNSVTTIGDNAFADCSKLSNVTYLGAIEPKAGRSVFAYCSNLKYVSVSPSYSSNIFAGLIVVKNYIP